MSRMRIQARPFQRLVISCLLSTVLLPLVLGAAISSNGAVSQATPSGVYIGVGENNLDVFLGIPYAQPPVGNLRFRRPVAANFTPETIVNAQRYGPRCLQSFHANDASEDCLTLNIWRPRGITGPVPVMIWIYGGSFILGMGESSSYPGTGLVSKSASMGKPIIYVSFNYRMGFFGFPVGAGALHKGTTNLGLYDQRMAIEWVQNNIRYFGGDPAKVTLFGESAGAISVSYQMMYKQGQVGNAFSQVILQSGAPMSYRAASQDSAPRQKAYNLIVAQTGCDRANDQFECLRTLDVNKLQQVHVASYKLAQHLVALANFPAAYGPVINADDDFLPEHPRFTVNQNKYANLPMIIGSNLDEGTWFVPQPKTADDIVAFLATKEIGCSFAMLPQASSPIVAAYPDDPVMGSPYGTGQETFGRGPEYKRAASVIGDLLFTAPRRIFTQTSATTNRNVWSYLFAQPTGGQPMYGVAHTSEIPYVFGNVSANSPADMNVSDLMQQYWINFATYGNPSYPGSNLPYWPPYGNPALERNMMQLKAGDYSVMKDDFREALYQSIQARAHQLF